MVKEVGTRMNNRVTEDLECWPVSGRLDNSGWFGVGGG